MAILAVQLLFHPYMGSVFRVIVMLQDPIPSQIQFFL